MSNDNNIMVHNNNLGKGKGYTAKLKTLLDPVNQLLTEASKSGVFFELYMDTFPGGDAATYSCPRDRSEGEAASAECVSFIEITDVYKRDPADKAYRSEIMNGEILYSTMRGDLVSVNELERSLAVVNERLEGATCIGNTLIASPKIDIETVGILRMFLSNMDDIGNEITRVYPDVKE